MKWYRKKYIWSLLVASSSIAFLGCNKNVVVQSEQTIEHNGITYGVIKSPVTSKKWLDRNLWAEQVCNSPDDKKCYGGYYQYGRNNDGHQIPTSQTSNIRVDEITDANNSFILAWRWTYSDDQVLIENWKKIDGSSVCPNDFRLPTFEEIKAELNYSIIEPNTIAAYKSFLKIPMAGFRDYEDGDIKKQGEVIRLWLSPDDKSSAITSYEIKNNVALDTRGNVTGFGLSIRCIHK